MTREKVFETASNGYRLFIIRDIEDDYMSLGVDNSGNQYVNITADEREVSINTILKTQDYDKLQFKISTYSNGSKTVDELREYLNGYEKAIRAVKDFEHELLL